MTDEDRINPGHREIRGVLRLIGPAILLLGLLLVVIGVVDFFASFGSFEPPKRFWMIFLGMPLFALGSALTKAGYLGSLMRYFAGETAPVQKDTFNYLATGTSEGLRSAARSIAEGASAGLATPKSQGIDCRQCGEPNDHDANFCKACGTAIQAANPCPACGEINSSAAKFCDHCGKQITEGRG